MNEYVVSSIKDGSAVLVNGGLTINVPLLSLPGNLRAGDILTVDSQGKYFRKGDFEKSEEPEHTSPRDELFQGETFEIKQGVDYNTLLSQAQQTLYKSTESELKHLVPELLLMLLSILCVLSLLLVDLQRFRDSIVHHDISAYLGTICSVFIASIGALALILALIAVFRTLKKLRKHVDSYKLNLRRIREKLMNNNVFLEISPEDEHRYDNVITQISETLKNREKNT